jgi:hypothetical protein
VGSPALFAVSPNLVVNPALNISTSKKSVSDAAKVKETCRPLAILLEEGCLLLISVWEVMNL